MYSTGPTSNKKWQAVDRMHEPQYFILHLFTATICIKIKWHIFLSLRFRGVNNVQDQLLGLSHMVWCHLSSLSTSPAVAIFMKVTDIFLFQSFCSWCLMYKIAFGFEHHCLLKSFRISVVTLTQNYWHKKEFFNHTLLWKSKDKYLGVILHRKALFGSHVQYMLKKKQKVRLIQIQTEVQVLISGLHYIQFFIFHLHCTGLGYSNPKLH